MEGVTTRKLSGEFLISGIWGELIRGQTLSCVHCQYTWQVEPGSGRRRRYCTKCMGYICEKQECLVCVPVERRLENCEAGRPELTPAPPMVAVPAMPEWCHGTDA